MKYAKYTSVIWGVVTLTLSLYAGDIAATVIEAINKVGSVFYGPILAIFLLAVFDKRLSALQVNIGLLVGVALNLFLWLSVPELFWFWWNLIGLVVTCVVAYTILIFSNKERPAYNPKLTSLSDTPAILTRKDMMVLIAYFIVMIAICLSIPMLFH